VARRAGAGGSFLASCSVAARAWSSGPFSTTLFHWIVAGDFEPGVTRYVDALTASCCWSSPGGLLIHLYSTGYMHDDQDVARYFAYLNLFVFSMTMLVLAGNFLLLFVFWEAVGLCSYLLIGFWYTRPAAAQAGKKAFIVNRIGDFGFGLGIMWLWIALGTLDYARLQGRGDAGAGHRHRHRALLFMAPAASRPSYRCTPGCRCDGGPYARVGADPRRHDGDGRRLHGARSHALFERSGVRWGRGLGRRRHRDLRGDIGWPDDIKRCWRTPRSASSATCSPRSGWARTWRRVPPRHPRVLQGAALPRAGQRDPRAARRAGFAEDGRSRLQDAHHRHDHVDRRARAGRRSAAGRILLQGRILAAALDGKHTPIFLLLVVGAFLTAFYTFRLLFLAFSGSPRMSKEVLHHAHESPWVMTLPLVVLSLLTLVAGFVFGLPFGGTRIAHLLSAVFAEHAESHSAFVVLVSVLVFAAGLGLAMYRYRMTPVKADTVGHPRTWLHAC
jgi:NADH-quinone oxidoreductase subunit L